MNDGCLLGGCINLILWIIIVIAIIVAILLFLGTLWTILLCIFCAVVSFSLFKTIFKNQK